ncbi:MAG: hypothetical protein AAF989_00300, partial [Planctomycetota bacterium]
ALQKASSIDRKTALTPKSRPEEIFHVDQVERILQQHERGTFDHANKIWLLLTYASWHRQNQATTVSASPSDLGTKLTPSP